MRKRVQHINGISKETLDIKLLEKYGFYPVTELLACFIEERVNNLGFRQQKSYFATRNNKFGPQWEDFISNKEFTIDDQDSFDGDLKILDRESVELFFGKNSVN